MATSTVRCSRGEKLAEGNGGAANATATRKFRKKFRKKLHNSDYVIQFSCGGNVAADDPGQ